MRFRFFWINGTNVTQEEVIYSNELYDAVEFEGPIIKTGDFAIWIRCATPHLPPVDRAAL